MATAASSPRRPGASPAGGTSYWALSRAPRYSITFALPLLVAYEGLAGLIGGVGGGRVRNGADVWLKAPFVALLGPNGPIAFGVLLVGLALALIVYDRRRTRAPLRRAIFLGMAAESVVMAVVCGLLVGMATTRLLQALPHAMVAAVPATGPALVAGAPLTTLDAPSRLMIALGAGLYEELLFRVVIVSGLMWIGRRVVGVGPAASALAATIGGALAFALAHHVGSMGEPITLAAFTFRALAGLFFSGLYVLRGFGITAWTHALYDVMVLLIR